MTDIIIIGAGVVGCAIARELSKYNADILVLEKEEDVCCETSKANSGIIHAGYDAKEGSLKAKLNMRGNEMIEELSKDLDFPFKRSGSFVVCTQKDDPKELERLLKRGCANGVKDLVILSKEEALQLEPNMTEDMTGVLYAKSAGIVCPFLMTIAFAENACMNGVRFSLNTKVEQIIKKGSSYLLQTTQGEYEASCVINAAGVFADEMHNMVSNIPIRITPRRGEYLLLDKEAGDLVGRTIFPMPGKGGKGILVSPTIHGNLFVGPNAEEIQDKEGINTTSAGIEVLKEKGNHNLKSLPLELTINTFAGLRANLDSDDFLIEEIQDAKHFFDVAGIASPGLSASPAIGEYVAKLVTKSLGLQSNPSFIPQRAAMIVPQNLTASNWSKLVKYNPAYGNIVCRCEKVTEGEIIDAIHRPIPARSVDAVKRRCRPGMGRCQGGFCMPKVLEILSKELGRDITDITKSGGHSNIVVCRNKEQ